MARKSETVSIYRKFTSRHGVTVIFVALVTLFLRAYDQYKLNTWQSNFSGKMSHDVITKPWNLRGNMHSGETRPDITLVSNVCKPKTHVGFLKTHKTGSSTIYNILGRVALHRNSDVVVAPPDQAHLCYASDFTHTEKCMINSDAKQNMLFNHVRFSQLVEETIPKDSF